MRASQDVDDTRPTSCLHGDPPRAEEGFWHGDGAPENKFLQCSRMVVVDGFDISACSGGTAAHLPSVSGCGPYRDASDELVHSTLVSGRMCNACAGHSFSKTCVSCDSSGFFHRPLIRVVRALLFVPGWFLIIDYMMRFLPSLSVAYPGLQVSHCSGHFGWQRVPQKGGNCQVIALIGQFDLGWSIGDAGKTRTTFFSYLSMINFNQELSYLDCSLDFQFFSMW